MFRRAQVDFKNRISRYSFVLLGLGLLLVATSCGTGTNPVDIMTEMHYQPSVKYQEPGTLDIPQDVMPYIHRGDPEAVFADAARNGAPQAGQPPRRPGAP